MTIESAERWLRFQWLGIAMLPAAYYSFSLSVLAATNYHVQRRRWVNYAILAVSILFAADSLFGNLVVDGIRFTPPISYLEAGPYFWVFTVFFVMTFFLALMNIWHARQRCLTEISRQRMTYLVIAFAAPGVAVFPYLVAVSRLTSANVQSGALLLTVSIVGNIVVGDDARVDGLYGGLFWRGDARPCGALPAPALLHARARRRHPGHPGHPDRPAGGTRAGPAARCSSLQRDRRRHYLQPALPQRDQVRSSTASSTGRIGTSWSGCGRSTAGC